MHAEFRSAHLALWLPMLLVACSAPPKAPVPTTGPTPATAVGAAASTAGEERPRPNILLVFADDHAYQAIGAYGSRINQTPNIDRLARGGMRFDKCLVTNSVCGPMRAVIQTGKYSHLNGFMVNRDRFDGSQPTFVKMLRASGYETAIIGKWHLGSTPQGFDHYEVLDGQGQYYNPPMKTAQGVVQYEGYVTDIVTDRTLHWLTKTRNPDKPFMLMFQHKAPHRRWEPSPKHLSMYEGSDIPEPETLFDDYAGRGMAARQQDMTIAESLTDRDLKLTPPPDLNAAQLATWNAAYGPRNKAFRDAPPQGDELTRWKYQRYIKDYLRCIASLDDNLGRILDFLDSNGLAENTLVIYSSDQGFYLGEHGWFDKRWMYEQSLRTPFIARWPGVIAPDSVNTALTSPLDFPETFLELAGLRVPDDMQGRSLLPLFRGERPADWRASFYYHYYEHPGWHYVRRHYGVTDGRYKLMHFYERDIDEWELYDLATDPDELLNVYAKPELRSERERLHAELTRLRQELKVPAEDPLGSRYADPPPRMRPAPQPHSK